MLIIVYHLDIYHFVAHQNYMILKLFLHLELMTNHYNYYHNNVHCNYHRYNILLLLHILRMHLENKYQQNYYHYKQYYLYRKIILGNALHLSHICLMPYMIQNHNNINYQMNFVDKFYFQNMISLHYNRYHHHFRNWLRWNKHN